MQASSCCSFYVTDRRASCCRSPAPVQGTADFKAMDTNGDGTITAADDPYLPYYPGQTKPDICQSVPPHSSVRTMNLALQNRKSDSLLR